MKAITSILATAGLILTSCNPTPNATDSSYMRCKLDGTLWESNKDDVGGIYTATGGLVTFSGTNGTILVNANLAGITHTGTFPVGGNSGSAMSVHTGSQFYYINVDFGNGFFYMDEIKDSGSDAHNLKGRFEGVATNASHDTLVITEGVIETF